MSELRTTNCYFVVTDRFLFEELTSDDPDRFKWLALELYALLQIGAPKDATDKVEAELTICQRNDQKLDVDVVTILKLRSVT